MNEFRIKKVSELATKMLISEMLELNLSQLHYEYLNFKDSVFIERERRAFRENKEAVKAFTAAITENIVKRLGFSSYLTIGKSQTYDTLISNSFQQAGIKKRKGEQPMKLNIFNLLPKDTFIKIDCGNRLVELQMNEVTVKSKQANLTPAPAAKKRIIYENKTLSLFS